MSNFNIELFETYLKKRIGQTYFDEFKNLLIQSGAVIAGGSLLGVYANDIPPTANSSDIDIYLHPSENALLLKNFIKRIGYSGEFDGYITPGYDDSFMMRNNIIGRVRYIKHFNDIDFIFVSPSFTIESVVSNFDLTFCEIWYDGNSVYAASPNDIINKTGFLKPEYVPSFLKLNKFTLRRIEKYKDRGFKVSIKLPGEICQESINFEIKSEEKRKISDSLRWFVFYMYKVIYSEQNGIFEFICNYPLREISVDEINEIINIIKNTNIDNRREFNRDNYIYYLTLPYIYMEISNSQRCSEYIFEHTGIQISELEMQELNNINEDNEDNEDIQPTLLESINVNEENLGNTCNDLVMLTEENVDEYLTNEENLLFISRGINNDFDMLCFEKDMIENMYNDRNGNWFYECTGPIIEGTNDRRISNPVNGNLYINTTPYVKIPIDTSGMNGFISAEEILSLLYSGRKAYYLEPALDEDGNQKMFTHTISHNNAYGSNPNWVSANHCQAGSSILIYTLKVCRNPETCIRSIVFNNEGEGEGNL